MQNGIGLQMRNREAAEYGVWALYKCNGSQQYRNYEKRATRWGEGGNRTRSNVSDNSYFTSRATDSTTIPITRFWANSKTVPPGTTPQTPSPHGRLPAGTLTAYLSSGNLGSLALQEVKYEQILYHHLYSLY